MRRITTLIVIIALLFTLFTYEASAANDVCFIAINETLLELNTVPYFYGSAYVPYSVFGGLKIYSSYFPSSNTISLYRSDRQLYFNLNTGQAYDGKDNYYSTSTLSKNGQIYVSVQFVCNFFGLGWSHIGGVGYGDVLRITDSGSYLSDSEFLSAATGLMQSRYSSYINSLPSPSPEVTPTPTPQTSPGTHEGTRVYLSFDGMPNDTILSALRSYSLSATFYLSPDEIAASPDMVRKIAGGGHSIGILCAATPGADYFRGSELLFDAAQIKTVMISSSRDSLPTCLAFAQAQGLVCYNYNLDVYDSGGAYVTDFLSRASTDTRIRFHCTQNTGWTLSTVLNYLSVNKFDLRPEREV